MRVYCRQKEYPIVELDEWEDDEEGEEEYSSNCYSSSDEDKNDHNTADDKDSFILKGSTDDELTDGDDIIENTNEESD